MRFQWPEERRGGCGTDAGRGFVTGGAENGECVAECWIVLSAKYSSTVRQVLRVLSAKVQRRAAGGMAPCCRRRTCGMSGKKRALTAIAPDGRKCALSLCLVFGRSCPLPLPVYGHGAAKPFVALRPVYLR